MLTPKAKILCLMLPPGIVAFISFVSRLAKSIVNAYHSLKQREGDQLQRGSGMDSKSR